MKYWLNESGGKIILTTFELEFLDGEWFNSKTVVFGDLGNCLGPIEEKRTKAHMESSEEATRNHNAFVCKYYKEQN